MMRVAAPSTYTLAPPSGTPPLLLIPLPSPSPPPLLLPSTDRKADRLKVYLPPQKRLCIAQGPRYEVGESSSAPRPTGGFRTDYGFVATLDAEISRDPKRDVGFGITDAWDEMLLGNTTRINGETGIEAQDARQCLAGFGSTHYKGYGRRIVGAESAVTVLTERVAELDRDNGRLKGTASVESQRVNRLQRGMARMQRELRLI
ncbi:hypothetical protein Tco_1475800 [Tanacetum coccineum]